MRTSRTHFYAHLADSLARLRCAPPSELGFTTFRLELTATLLTESCNGDIRSSPLCDRVLDGSGRGSESSGATRSGFSQLSGTHTYSHQPEVAVSRRRGAAEV